MKVLLVLNNFILVIQYYGCVGAHKQGYSAVWNEYQKRNYCLVYLGFIGASACAKAAEYGQLQALRWLKRNGRDWDIKTYACQYAARGGHLHILQWARETGCDWDRITCRICFMEKNSSAARYTCTSPTDMKFTLQITFLFYLNQILSCTPGIKNQFCMGRSQKPRSDFEQ